MSKVQNLCINQLEKIREHWLIENGSSTKEERAYVRNSEVEVFGETYRHDIYDDFSGDRMFVIFELAKIKSFGGSRYCVGIEFFNDREPSLVTMEELWNEGIP